MKKPDKPEQLPISEGSIIFCDDVRREINGKLSLIGTYTNEIIALNSEKTLPKLCAVARIIFKDDKKHTVNLSMKYRKNEYKIPDIKVPSSKDLHKMHIFVFDIQPFPIDDGGKIVVSLVEENKLASIIGELDIKKVDKLPESDLVHQVDL